MWKNFSFHVFFLIFFSKLSKLFGKISIFRRNFYFSSKFPLNFYFLKYVLTTTFFRFSNFYFFYVSFITFFNFFFQILDFCMIFWSKIFPGIFLTFSICNFFNIWLFVTFRISFFYLFFSILIFHFFIFVPEM